MWLVISSPDYSIYGTVYASCLVLLDSLRVMPVLLDSIRVICARCYIDCLVHFLLQKMSTVTFSFMKTFNWWLFFSQILSWFWLIGNRTSCRPILSVIILVINKSDSRCAVVRFCYHSYDYRPNWTPLCPITITRCFAKVVLNAKVGLYVIYERGEGWGRQKKEKKSGTRLMFSSLISGIS